MCYKEVSNLEIVIGDLLQAKENLILHQVNCQRKMKSGVAKQIREEYPIVYEKYMEYFNTQPNPLGHAQIVKIGDKKGIVNLFSQQYYGYDGKRYTNYEALYSALELVSKVANNHDFTVALPYKLGCDRGGGNWNIVTAMLKELFKEDKIKIYKLKGD